MSSIIITAMAFSCQDHHVPDPVEHCTLADGSPRALPCEFELLKVEFLNKARNRVIGTITQTAPRGDTLNREDAVLYDYLSGGYFWMRCYAKVHLKRIANPAVKPSGPYIADLSPAAYWDFHNYPRIAYMSNVSQQLTNLKLGQSIEITLLLGLDFHWNDLDLGPQTLAIFNNATKNTLSGPPYSYANFNYLSEAHIKIDAVLE